MKKSFYDWSNQEYSNLPWRKKRSLYGTLVSEIMLQQTNVSTVLKHYERFLKVFPNLKALACATEEEVCAHWQGLGYYRRARNLRKAAIAIVSDFKGKFPDEYDDLISIPGIGAYTANAIIAIGRDEEALALDANLERVISRLYGIKEFKGPKLLKLIQARQDEILKDFKVKQYGARVINESLMDLGRVYCQAKKADCLLCPLNRKCKTLKDNLNPLEIPIVKKKVKESFELELVRIIIKNKNTVIGYEKDGSEWLSGQIEVPTFILKSQDSNLSQYPTISLKDCSKYPSLKTAITKYKITNYVLEMPLKEFKLLLKTNKLSFDRYNSYVLDPQSIHFSTTSLKVFRLISAI